jgi:hypothetical protein
MPELDTGQASANQSFRISTLAAGQAPGVQVQHGGVRAFFNDTEVSVVGDTTVLRRTEAGQAAPHGLLHRIQDLGLELLDVHRESAEPA